MGPDPQQQRSDLPPPAPPSSADDGRPGSNGSGRRAAYDRVPPHSLDAEVSVLGAALLSKNAAAEVIELVAPDDFYRSSHRTIFEGVRELFSRGEPIDSVTVIDWLGRHGHLDEIGGAAAIHDLLSQVPTAANATHYARIVREKSMLRKLIEVGTEIVQIGYDGSDDSTVAVDRAEGLVYEVGQSGSSREYSQLKDLLNESFERIEQLAENRSEVTGLATGFNDLDRLTAGLQPQNLVIIAARPAMGKSSLSMGLAHYVTSELLKPAIVFSLEMSKQEIVMRLLSSEARIDSSKIRTGRLADNDWRKLGDALGKLSNAPLFIDDTPSITLMEIRSKARRLKQRHGLELVIVDYLQLMSSHKRVDNRQQEVAEFSRGLKMLAKELDVPVIALSQLSRQPETRTDKRPQLSDLRESGSLEQDADIVGFIYRDEVYDEESPDRGIAELIIAKHRNGPTGTVKLAFLNHLTKFANLAHGATGGPGAVPPAGGQRPPGGPTPV